MKICVLVLLLGVANGGLLGSKKCTWGPSYWCENFQQADECGATEHCHNNVWNQLKKPAVLDDSSACTFCKDMVSDVRNFIESNQTRATVMQYMNKACNFLPDAYSQQECVKIEQHYMDQFEKCIQNKIDPDNVCKLVRLCRSDLTQLPPSVPKSDLVQAQPILPAQLTHVSLKSSALGLQAQDEPLCDACKSFVDLAKKEINDPKVQGAVKDRLETMCKKMSGTTEIECEAAVSMALPEVFKIASRELTDQLCVSAGLCTSSVMSASAAAAATKERLRAALHSDTVREIMVQTAKRVRADLCDTCEEVAGFLKIFLSNNETEAQLQDFLTNEVCPQLGEFQDMCKTLVEQYTPQLYNLLVERLDPATICKDLRLCSATTAPIVALPPTPAPAVKKEKAKASVQCVICEFVMSKLDSLLAKNATEEEIVNAVEKVCSILPSTVKDECDSLVEKYGKAIIKLLVNDASPSVICGFIGLCGSGDSLYKLPLLKDDELCSLCETAITYLVSMLKDNATEEEIVENIEKVCNFLSGQMAQECNSLVEMYGPVLIKQLVDNMKPEPVCKAVGLCQSTKPMKKADGLVHLFNY